MDAVKFIKEINRLCEAQEDCEDCPLIGHACDVNTATIMSCYNIESVQKMVQIVEQWAKDHPVKTRQSEFLKLFPDADILTIEIFIRRGISVILMYGLAMNIYHNL